MKQIHFLIDDDFGAGDDLNLELKDAVTAAGHEHHRVTRNDYYMDRIGRDVPQGARCVFFGSMQVARKVSALRPDLSPGVLLDEPKMKHSYFWQWLPNDMLNSHCIYLPFAMIRDKTHLLNEVFGNKVFIRPDAGNKVFPGTVIKLNSEWLRPGKFPEVPGDTMTLIASELPQRDHATESRFFIINGSVVASSLYKKGGAPCVNTHVPTEAAEAAQRFATQLELNGAPMGWAYVMDVALSRSGEPKIVEYNSFSCSGQYACDRRKIVDAVTSAALEQIQRDLEGANG